MSLLQGKTSQKIPVISPKFSIVSLVNHGEAANPGELVELVLVYGNNGEYTIENAEIAVEFIGDYWNLKQTNGEVGKIVGKTMIWTFKELPRLALVQPKEGGEIKFNIGTRNFVAMSNDFSLNVKTNLRYKIEGQEVQVFSEIIETKLNSNLSVKAYPVYYTVSGDQLGRGPLPPKVGQETKYWVFAQIMNDISPVSNVVVTAHLPMNVVWTDKSNVAVGDPVGVDSSGKILTWKISQAPVKPEGIGFAFELAIIPTASQSGKYPLLISELNVSGIDSKTGRLINKKLNGITTQLVYDKKGKGKDGVVK